MNIRNVLGMTKHCIDIVNNRCPICQYDVKNKEVVKRLPCSHIYHSECIIPWLKRQKACPLCACPAASK